MWHERHSAWAVTVVSEDGHMRMVVAVGGDVSGVGYCCSPQIMKPGGTVLY